jgi:2OG-Fe(II) oxygenase superfamily
VEMIVFLNPEWDERWGGCLELCRDPWGPQDSARSIAPIANRAVLFETTERSWHGFKRLWLPDGVSRRSIAVYFYSVDRPAVETAPSHGTVYAPRPLPEHLQAGYTLREEDAHEMRLLIARRDAQIRYLYGRELEFARALTGVMRSPSYRLGRFLTWPARWLRDIRAKFRS